MGPNHDHRECERTGYAVALIWRATMQPGDPTMVASVRAAIGTLHDR
jgi:hypothetical protein